MKIYPAIDIIGRECVRLVKGDYSQKTTYSQNPVEVAKSGKKQAVNFFISLIWMVKKSGDMPNFELIRTIVSELNIPVEVGGGIRSMECVDKYLNAGICESYLGNFSS